MKIIELRAENVKRLHAVQVTPEGSIVVVGGKNGAGKSSLLDSIVYALNGAASLPGKPVRKGEEHAEIELKLDGEPNLLVRRRIRDDGKTDLEIKQLDADGKPSAKVTSPQKLLDSLCGTVAFDPLAFTKFKRTEQVDMLRQLVGVDVADLDAEEGRLFNERTNVNRDVKGLESQIAAAKRYEGVPEEEISAKDILSEIETANATNANIDRRAAALVDAEREAERIATDIQKCENEIEGLRRAMHAKEGERSALKGSLDGAKVEIAGRQEWLESVSRVDTAPIAAKLENVERTNSEVRANKARLSLLEKCESATDQAEDLSQQIETCRRERIERLAAATWPVDGLAFGDSGVTFNGLPFDQCSSAEQLRISTAIGLAQNPKLRVLLIRDGSLLDEDNLAAIAALADEHDAQVWIERVGRGQECSVIIEDGSVAKPKQSELALA